MLSEFKELISKKSDSELMEYFNNIGRYSPEAISTVVNVLKERDHVFSDEEIRLINEQIQKKKEIKGAMKYNGPKQTTQ